MSSLYRKGRDGYFYYQRYVKSSDNKTKKKIFHSLGTKSRKVAEKKRRDYDQFYDNYPPNKTNFTLLNYFNKNSYSIKAFFIFVLFISLIAFYLNIFENDGMATKAVNHTNSSQDSLSLKLTVEKNIESVQTKASDSTEIENNYKSIKLNEKLILPNYRIERVELLSVAFNQAKIYLLTDNNLDKETLLYLCEKIKSDFQQYDNLVICVYNNSEVGNALASGANINIDQLKMSQEWLAMYTYNKVEGSFFDNNPTLYLGGIQ